MALSASHAGCQEHVVQLFHLIWSEQSFDGHRSPWRRECGDGVEDDSDDWHIVVDYSVKCACLGALVGMAISKTISSSGPPCKSTDELSKDEATPCTSVSVGTLTIPGLCTNTALRNLNTSWTWECVERLTSRSQTKTKDTQTTLTSRS